MIYSGDKDIQTNVISLADSYFGGDKTIDVNVKVLTNGVNNDIVYQYNVLKEFMSEREKEVVTMMALLFNEEKLMEAYDKELLDEGRTEAIAGNLRALMRNMNLTLEEVMTALSIPLNERDIYKQVISV